ncbi:MAG TPA: flagellar hook-basal body complex protein [Xanthobacteraceae bacterium]|nr:flagellar hook-basal body complex protein [Xanthobacteraceae bacterium]
MGIFDALTTAVSGLGAQAYALQNISGNIANSQTIAYKRINTSFKDLIGDNLPSKQIAGGVLASSVATNGVQGDLQNVSTPTFMAINGNGYFIVKKPDNFSGNQPVFSGVNLYTRRGDFLTDKNGYLVNQAGYYLMGLPVDPTTGNPVGSVPVVLQFTNNLIPAQPTTQVLYNANLPSYPLTSSTQPGVPGSNLLNPSGYTSNPITGGVVLGADVTLFVSESVAGGSITGYDSLGAPANLQFRWAKIDSTEVGGTDTWNLFYQTNTNPGSGDPAWVNAGVDFIFDAAGQLNPPITSITLTGVVVDSITLGDISMMFGANGITQFANSNGTVQVNLLDQDGAPAGQLQSVAVDDQGRIVGTYSNGRIIPLAVVTLANFNGQNYLKRLDGGAYAETADSGPPIMNATGKIVGSSLEASNSDIADEFSKLIVTQQAYSANTRIITTTNLMVQDLLNVIR